MSMSPYFSSTTPVGPDRLAEAIGESAFYTAELARIMGMQLKSGLRPL
jgi:hypothetical protein